MDSGSGMLRGRPFGGLAILWRKSLGPLCTVTLTDDSRLMQIDVKINSQIITLLNLYLPYDNGTNLDEFQMYLSKVDSTLLRSGGNYHHSMFHNPTAAVNLFHVGKQYLTLCKAKAAVTRNLIGRKIISNVKHADARNSLPILDVIRSSHKRHSASEYCK